MARKLAVRLYWMLRKEWDYEQLTKFVHRPHAHPSLLLSWF